MTFGFRTRGDSGYYQIDETNPNLLFVNKYQLTSDGNRTATLTISGELPIPVIHAPDTWVGQYRTDRSGNTWTYYFLTYTAGASFWVYLFDRLPQGAARANWSLNVYGPDGRLNFAGDRKQLRPYAVVPQTIGDTTNPGVGSAVPNGTWGAVADNPWYTGAAGPGGTRVIRSSVRTYWTAISYWPLSFPTGVRVPTSQLNAHQRNFVVFDLNGI